MAFCRLHAQPGIDGLINAEKNFAAYSVAHGTKAAFLQFIDSNGIVFDQGQAKNGREVWTRRDDRSPLLNWAPQWAEIAFSGDFGYTTGPWELRSGHATDTVMARGRYTTVWHRDAHGAWKFLLDLGVGHTRDSLPGQVREIQVEKVKGISGPGDMLREEKRFIEVFRRNPAAAYARYLSANGILNRNGGSTGTKDVIGATPPMELRVEGSGMASSGDMGFVYGNTLIDKKQENYVHLWRREKTGWKIALEVLRY